MTKGNARDDDKAAMTKGRVDMTKGRVDMTNQQLIAWVHGAARRVMVMAIHPHRHCEARRAMVMAIHPHRHCEARRAVAIHGPQGRLLRT